MSDLISNTKSTLTHIAYTVQERGGKSYWTRIGVMFCHKDGKGFNLQLECLPVDGRISLRWSDEKKDEQ